MRFINNMVFMFKHSWEISKRRIISAVIEIIMNTIEPFIYLIFPTLIINELTERKDWKTILFYLLAFIGCILILRVINIVCGVFISLSYDRSSVKDGLFYERHFLKMDYDKFEDEEVRNIQQIICSNVRENGFILMVSNLLTSLFKLIGFSYIITMLDPTVLIFILGIIIINYFLNKRQSKINYKYQPILAKHTRIFDYLYNTMTNFDYAKEIRVNKANKILSKKFRNAISKYSSDNKKFLSKQFATNIISGIVSLIQMLVSYGYVAYNAIINTITVGEFNLYIGAIYNLSGSFNDVVARCIELKYMSHYVDDYYKYIDLALPSKNKKDIFDLPKEDQILPMFEFENVSFIYPNTEKIVLDNISIKIRKGEKLSIVGLNGAGKTTFIKLLCRLYTPTKGVIKYYGVDISTIKKEEYYKLLAVVFQDFKIFSFSFLDNIVLSQSLDTDRLNRSIENAGLKSKLEALPDGLNTNIYKDFDENGIEFSGGEGQKLVIARAYYKDADLVILDEPTAALDALAENEIYQNFNEITLNKTSIFISHRLASTRFCDNIAVFQNGNIVEYGDHETLLKQNGLYSEMFKKQAQYYNENQEVSVQ